MWRAEAVFICTADRTVPLHRSRRIAELFGNAKRTDPVAFGSRHDAPT